MNKIHKHINQFLYLSNQPLKEIKKKLHLLGPSPFFEQKIHHKSIELIQEFSSAEEQMLLPKNLPLKQITNIESTKETDTAQINELLVDELSQLTQFRDFFNIVPSKAKKGFVPEQEEKLYSYAEIIQQAELQGVSKDLLDVSLDKLSAQKYAIFQILIKSQDAQGKNILIQQGENNSLIPISSDFTRCLGNDPNNEYMLPRTTRWEKWPALSEELDPELKEFVLSLDPQEVVENTRENFLFHMNFAISTEQSTLLEEKFNHLQSNIILLQESVKANLMIKQMLALILPMIDVQAFNFVTQNILKGSALWPARQRYSTLKTSFKLAWNEAHTEGHYHIKIFKEKILQEIKTIKALSLSELETNYFQEICYELRRGLYL